MAVAERVGFICTYSGKKINPLDAQPEDMDIEDIAWALSNVCRYAGHCRQFYSVAQHSVLVSQYAAVGGQEFAAWGLLHDAPEAYLGDIPAPLKVLPEWDFYREAEDRLMDVIAERFGIGPCPKEEIKKWDIIIHETEMRDFGSVPVELRNPQGAIDIRINPVDSLKAYKMFKGRYNLLAKLGWINL